MDKQKFSEEDVASLSHQWDILVRVDDSHSLEKNVGRDWDGTIFQSSYHGYEEIDGGNVNIWKGAPQLVLFFSTNSGVELRFVLSSWTFLRGQDHGNSRCQVEERGRGDCDWCFCRAPQ